MKLPGALGPRRVVEASRTSVFVAGDAERLGQLDQRRRSRRRSRPRQARGRVASGDDQRSCRRIARQGEERRFGAHASPSTSASNACSATAPAAIVGEALGDQVRHQRRRRRCRARDRAPARRSRGRSRLRAAVERSGRRSAGSIGSGTPSSENIITTKATTAGMKAIR